MSSNGYQNLFRRFDIWSERSGQSGGMVLPGHPPTTLDYGQTYHINGWTILPSGDGITFTNDGTGHGMTVGSDQSVKPF
jgi:hypothetical protein